jgi:ferritin-like metal-binding protein YciE
MAKEPKTLDELFHDTLKDIYYAERKILSALPKMAKAAQSEELRAAFEKHRGETEEQISRLEQVFEEIDAKPQGKKCAAIEGILDEGQEVIKEYKGSPALDAGMLAAAQAVEHYEISRYGTLRTWAAEMGLDGAVKLLEETLEEEKATDQVLTELAETAVNDAAERAYPGTAGIGPVARGPTTGPVRGIPRRCRSTPAPARPPVSDCPALAHGLRPAPSPTPPNRPPRCARAAAPDRGRYCAPCP